jgi:hypothetical protein
MPLPQQLKTARMSNSTDAAQIDDKAGELEIAAALILGIPIDTDISNALFSCDTNGLQEIIFQDSGGDPPDAGGVALDTDRLKFNDGSVVKTLAHTDDILTQVGLGGTRKLLGLNNTGAPTQQYDISWDYAQFYNPSDDTIVIEQAGSVTIDITQVGPVANGRDQAGAFSSDSWCHLYLIRTAAGTVAGLASATAPPTGPTLPATYVSWVYVGAIRINVSGNLVTTYIRGNEAFYAARQSVVANGAATTETSIALTKYAPPNATKIGVSAELHCQTQGGGGTVITASMRWFPGSDFVRFAVIVSSTTIQYNATSVVMPHVSATIYYILSGTTGGPLIDIYIDSYVMPNGAN